MTSGPLGRRQAWIYGLSLYSATANHFLTSQAQEIRASASFLLTGNGSHTTPTKPGGIKFTSRRFLGREPSGRSRAPVVSGRAGDAMEKKSSSRFQARAG